MELKRKDFFLAFDSLNPMNTKEEEQPNFFLILVRKAHGFSLKLGLRKFAEEGDECGRKCEAFGFPKSAHN